MKALSLISFLFLIQLHAFSQPTTKEGVATFQFTYPDAESEKAIAGRSKGIKLYFKEGNSRAEYDNESRWVIIIDSKGNEIISMGTADHKTAEKMSFKEKEDNQGLEFGTYDVKVTGDTKDIAGYSCSKAVVTYKGVITSNKYRTMEVWFTDKLAASNTEYRLKGINGFIMEYTHVTTPELDKEFREVLTCTKVEKATVPDSLFKLPYGCKVISDANSNYKIEMH